MHHTLKTARTPSAFHVVVTNLFPVNIQFLQSFKHFSNYLSWMGSRLSNNYKQMNLENSGN